ncbi:MAG: hypothetical protein HON32_07050 [Francisellaceae bacterium]|nr:hypothetical protein [Francisellaceae bacterium]MBT6539747.1 hypothetical protein [Francisellaceae bacterium]
MKKIYDGEHDAIPHFSAVQQKVVDKYLDRQSLERRKEVDELFNNILSRANLISPGKLERPKKIIKHEGKSSSAPAEKAKSISSSHTNSATATATATATAAAAAVAVDLTMRSEVILYLVLELYLRRDQMIL